MICKELKYSDVIASELEATLDMVLREDIFEKVTCRQKCEKEANT
jgi:hypothetical protein